MAAVIAWFRPNTPTPGVPGPPDHQGPGISGILSFWPRLIASAWKGAAPRLRLFTVLGTGGLMGLLVSVLWPYYHVTRMYGFKRHWPEIETMVPRLQSYLLADVSHIWRFTSAVFAKVPMAHEQQMFIGAGAIGLVLIGSLWKRTPHRTAAVVNGSALLLLFLLTLHLAPHSRYTLYRPLAYLPGLSAIRAVCRIILVMLWPVGVLAAIGLDAMWRSRRLLFRTLACVLLAVTFIESAWISQVSFSKSEAAQRLEALRASLPQRVPASPILVVPEGDQPSMSHLDAMLLSQSLGWSTINGYSGNAPPGWCGITSCSQVPKTIAVTLALNDRLTPINYGVMAANMVPVGFDDCPPEFPKEPPSFTVWPGGPLPSENKVTKCNNASDVTTGLGKMR